MEDLRVIGRGSKNRWMVWNSNLHLHKITLSVKSAKTTEPRMTCISALTILLAIRCLRPFAKKTNHLIQWDIFWFWVGIRSLATMIILGPRHSQTNYPLTSLWGPRARTDTPNIQHRRRQVTHLGAYYSKYHYTPTRREHAIRIKPLIAYLDYYIRTVRVNWLINWWG